MSNKFATVEAYLASVPEVVRPVVERVRAEIAAAVPEANETISYNLPAFRLGRVFIYFAGFKAHLGIYPPLAADDPLAPEITQYRGEKGNLKFLYRDGIPFALIGKLAKALARQYATNQAG